MLCNLFNHSQYIPIPFKEKEKSFFGRQQFIVLVYYFTLLVIGLGMNLLDLTGPQKSFNFILNCSCIFVVTILFAIYLAGKLSLPRTLGLMTIASQLSTSVEMVHCAFIPDEYHLMLIVGNIVLLTANVMVSMIAYLEYTPYILSFIGIGTYTASIFITGDETLLNFFGLYLAIFITLCVLGNRLVKNVRTLHKENADLKKDEESLFNVLKLEKEQVKAYISLAQETHGIETTGSLLDMLGEDAQKNVIANVRNYLLVQDTEKAEMERLFPELSYSEREVCGMILQGKKLREICSLLGKTETNINSTRAHIRKKLGLAATDNLSDALQTRVRKMKKENSP